MSYHWISEHMQKKITGFLIATIVFNVTVFLTIYLIEIFAREVSLIWSWLLFATVVLGVGAFVANVTNRVKLSPRAGVFAFFWSVVFAVLVRFYYHDYTTLINARIAEPLTLSQAVKAKKQYDYFRFKNFVVDKEKPGYELKKDSLIEKSDPKKGTFHYYVAPLRDTQSPNMAPTVFIGKHYIGIEPNYKEIFQKRVSKKADFFKLYPTAYTFQGAIQTVNPGLKREKNYILLQATLSPFDLQKSSFRHLLILWGIGNIIWILVILGMQISRKKTVQTS